jgi:hypothetical protein
MRIKYQGLLLFLMGICVQSNAQLSSYQEQYKVGYRNADGRVIVPPVYDAGSDMSEGFAVVLRGPLRGYINNRGQETIACQYEDASPFVDGLACVKKDGKWGFINTDGAWAIQPLFDNAFSYKNGLARVMLHDKWGMIDEQGQFRVPPIYVRLSDLSCGLIAASFDDRHHGYIDAGGKVTIEFRYSQAQPFDEATQRAIVYMGNEAFFIDKTGKLRGEVPQRKDEDDH